MRRHCHPHRGPMRRYLAARLHRRLFVLLGASMVMTALVVGLVQLAMPGPGWRSWNRTLHNTETLVAEQFADVWDDPPRRAHLAERLHDALGMSVVVESASGSELSRYGDACARAEFRADVTREGRVVGRVVACGGHHGGSFALVLLVLGVTLWGGAGMVARRLVRPLGEVAQVADAIGAGKLESRVRIGRRHVGEVAVLADAINNMADRIEQQLADQRELLAGACPRDPFAAGAHARPARACALEGRGRPRRRRESSARCWR